MIHSVSNLRLLLGVTHFPFLLRILPFVICHRCFFELFFVGPFVGPFLSALCSRWASCSLTNFNLILYYYLWHKWGRQSCPKGGLIPAFFGMLIRSGEFDLDSLVIYINDQKLVIKVTCSENAGENISDVSLTFKISPCKTFSSSASPSLRSRDFGSIHEKASEERFQTVF